MTRDEAKQLLPIITAFCNGETIQRDLDNIGWVDIDHGCRDEFFVQKPAKYRIKPNPREFWAPSFDLYETKEGCEARWPGREIIHVKEVV